MRSYILVVEDNADLRLLYRQALALEGYQVDLAANGADALAMLRARAEPPSLILLDLMMPLMSGWEFLEEVARDPALGHLPVVVCSAARDRIPMGVRFLRKPVELDTLLQIAKDHCTGVDSQSPASAQ